MKRISLVSIIILIAAALGISTGFSKSILHKEKQVDMADTAGIATIDERNNLPADNQKAASVQEDEKNIISLKFNPMPVEVLSPFSKDAGWKLKDSKAVFNVAGKEQVSVNLYQKNAAEIKAVLQDLDGLYDLGLTLEGDNEGLSVQAKDMNQDGTLELVLLADRGATYQEAKVYTFDDGKWKCILAGENLSDVDLNNDGQNELVTTSMGSLPGYVWIYRWTGQQFEKSDVVKDLGAVYAVLTTIDGKTVIEAGKENNPKYYTYADGKLIEVN